MVKLTTLMPCLDFFEDGCDFCLFRVIVNPPLQSPGLFKDDGEWLHNDIESSSTETKFLLCHDL